MRRFGGNADGHSEHTPQWRKTRGCPDQRSAGGVRILTNGAGTAVKT